MELDDNPTSAVQEPVPGSCAEVAQTLARWARLSPRGLARVECNSEYARLIAVQQIKDNLTTDGFPFHEIHLPRDCSAIDAVRQMLSQLRTLEPGVVSISGFPSAFPHDDDFYPLNANRENFAETPHRQIWWMPASFSDRFLRFAPDLHSWFLIRPVLSETPYPRAARNDFDNPVRSSNIHIDDARRHAASLYQRFRRATEAQAPWEDRVDLASQAVQTLIDAGAHREALELFEKVIDRVKPSNDVMATQSIEIAKRFVRLASIYSEFGRYSEAEPLIGRVLEICERVLGPDHPDTATSLNHLASLYYRLGQYERAEPLYRRALQICERVLGPDHPSTATSLNNLANLYEKLRQNEKAEPLYRRALEIRERVLGPDHPDTATSLGNLAYFYNSLGQYEQAESISKRALEIRERVLGPDHPDTARSLNNLAYLYDHLGRYDQAEPLYGRALEICERVLGPDHPDTVASLNNLASLYNRLNQYDQAEPLHRRALETCERVLGPDHPETARNLNNLAYIYHRLGQYEQAEPLYKRALRIHERVLGLHHPHVAIVLENLASLLEQQGRVDEAKALQERATLIWRQHPRSRPLSSTGNEHRQEA